MELNPVIERFYKDILKLAGMELNSDGVIADSSGKLGDIKLDDCFLSLPYLSKLKNPSGLKFFHLLNESYSDPETATYDLYRDKLVLDLNLRTSALVMALITIGSDPKIQQKINTQGLVEIVAAVGETDMQMVEVFAKLTKASIAKNRHGFIFDLYQKKNGKIDGEDYGAICKVNFKLYKEICKALDAADYSVYGVKLRKKDLLCFRSAIESIFPELETEMGVGSDSKVFRYLSTLVQAAGRISDRLNEIGEQIEVLDNPILLAEDIVNQCDWSRDITELSGMGAIIRLIPCQDSLATETNHRRRIDESAAEVAQPVQAAPAPQPAPQQQVSFNPGMVAPAPAPATAYASPQAATAPQPLSPEELIRAKMRGIVPNQAMTPMQQPMMNQMLQQPMMNPMMQPQQVNMPAWMRTDPAVANNVAQQQMQQQLQQQLLQQQMVMGGGMPMQQPMMNPMMQQQYEMMMRNQMQGMQPQPQGGMQLNPHMQGRVNVPW